MCRRLFVFKLIREDVFVMSEKVIPAVRSMLRCSERCMVMFRYTSEELELISLPTLCIYCVTLCTALLINSITSSYLDIVGQFEVQLLFYFKFCLHELNEKFPLGSLTYTSNIWI